ncbi:hypothetical protein CG740_23005 [Streptomyces sp. CB01201]|uniref:hypothetical protein n=1 Tax=Streptomyces sp. CB01201 TaxID=2020324 RepID=UPI000C27FBBC|nr:hypothetical protein [Streptomyces sp. CB01201]PJN00778.1 hypothetical protein CG740_23005 [Streptomyces sp. CB01201]
MAIELTDELIELERSAEAEREKALAGPYSVEAWRPWRDAAEAVQAAITAHAEAIGQPRFDVEAALKKLVRHPEPEGA